MGDSNLFVGGLPDGIDDESFQQLFEGSGTITSCKCVPEKRYGFVNYASRDEAQAVVEAMHGFQFNGTTLQVRFAEKGGGKDGGKGGGKDWGGGKDGGKGGGKGWGKNGKDGGKGWGGGKDKGPPEEADPSDNLYIKGLPADFTDAQVQEVFGAYGTVAQAKLMSFGNGSTVLMRMGSVEMATWIVENLNGNIPQGLESPVQIRYADSATAKAKKMQKGLMKGMEGEADDYGAAKGKGKGKKGPYGKGGPVKFGNLDQNLPLEIKSAVDAVIFSMGGGGKKHIAHSGDESNLYVKDLPGTADELYIYKLFSPFGPLESIVIKKGDCGTWAIAFVKFMGNEGAAKAVMGMSSCLLPDGTMPKVSVKVAKPDGGKGGKGKKGEDF